MILWSEKTKSLIKITMLLNKSWSRWKTTPTSISKISRRRLWSLIMKLPSRKLSGKASWTSKTSSRSKLLTSHQRRTVKSLNLLRFSWPLKTLSRHASTEKEPARPSSIIYQLSRDLLTSTTWINLCHMRTNNSTPSSTTWLIIQKSSRMSSNKTKVLETTSISWKLTNYWFDFN